MTFPHCVPHVVLDMSCAGHLGHLRPGQRAEVSWPCCSALQEEPSFIPTSAFLFPPPL